MCLLTSWFDSETLGSQSPDLILLSAGWMYKARSCFLSSVGQANYVFKLHFQAACEITRNTSPSLTSWGSTQVFPHLTGRLLQLYRQNANFPQHMWDSGSILTSSCLRKGVLFVSGLHTPGQGVHKLLVDFLVIGVLTCSPLHTWVPDRLSG